MRDLYDNNENLIFSVFKDDKCKKCTKITECYIGKSKDKNVCLETNMLLYKKHTEKDSIKIIAESIFLMNTLSEIIAVYDESQTRAKKEIIDITVNLDY